MKLEKMTEEEFNNYIDIAVVQYAEDKIKAETWEKSEAKKLAQESFTKLLPKGIDSENNFLFSVWTAESSIEPIGMIWVNVSDQKVFIYDFMIDESYRGKGYGKSTLKLLDKWASENGFTQIGLHVFAHNKSAYHLYKKMGYVETDITMVHKIN